MNYLIRFNKNRGNPGRGTVDHVWRVFEDGKEFLCKHVKINVNSYSQTDGLDWNFECKGKMEIDKETSTITINEE
jgi:hypothetical protein